METDFNYIDCIEKVKQHDDSASEALYRFTFPIAQKQVALFVHNRQDQEDLLQTIFIKIFEQLHTLKEPEKYPGWAKMIARNTCMDYGRHLKLENNLIQWKTTVSDEEEEGMDQLAVPTYSREFNPEAHIDAETTKELIDQILDGLSDKQRMVILLWMKQYKESEIAKELDMPIGSVRTNCRRGKAAIEKKVIELEKQGTKLYSMSPIVFFLWLLDQYDMLYMPTFTDAVCMPLYHKIKLHIHKPDINNETVRQMQNTIKDTGSNTSNAASSLKQARKAVSVTKGGLKHGILHSTVTKAVIGIVIAGSVGGAAVHYNQQKQDNVQQQEAVKEENAKKTAAKEENTVDSNDVNHNIYGITLDMVSGTDLVALNTNIWDNSVSLVAKNEKDDLWMYEVTVQDGEHAGEHVTVIRNGEQLFIGSGNIPIIADYLYDYPVLEFADMDGDGDQEIVFYMADSVGARYVDGPFKNDTNGISSDTFEYVVGLGENALYPIMSYIFTLDGTDFSKSGEIKDNWFVNSKLFDASIYRNDLLGSKLSHELTKDEIHKEESENKYIFSLGGQEFTVNYKSEDSLSIGGEPSRNIKHWNKYLGEGHGNYQLKYKNGKCHLTFPFALYNNFYLFYTPVYVGEGECNLTYHEQNNKNSSGYMEYGDIKIKQTGPTKRDKREE
ncbi:sigma-70 family RNA polymerase sigma factor [Dorea longicatena]|uniref:RNA polymerase sigma factor n=1 Tax=Dorea longicatena TaxID=88431 RepID=UPI00156E3699|nr:sigma-70 family RNA polymerase sigma factor [Dorea longicatena]NSC55225.1 sigma-70 family RNA polymerase sigma factor [Dorea longicatena]NSD07325.1 sigma-70 family RNA polymerase sigma factor [Dorea longicatena]NSF10750.1 sigma-70 family RNA polymerase sigma factor [Dorea longicatena]